MIKNLLFLIKTFAPGDRLRLALFVPIQFLISLMDLLGIAVILPLVQIVMGGSITTGYVGELHKILGSPDRVAFVLIISAIMVFAFLAKAIFSLLMQWWSTGLVARLQVGTGHKLITHYLTEGYLEHKRRSSAEVARVLDGATNDAHSKVLGGSLALVSSLLSIATVLVFLVVVQPVATVLAIGFFGGAVFLTQRLLGRRNGAAGAAAVQAAWDRTRSIFDAIDGYREVRVHNAVAFFSERFDEANTRATQASRRANYYQVVPRYVLELLTITGIALLLGYVSFSESPQTVMATLAIFVAATVRLLPVLVSLTAQIGMVRNGETGLGIVVEELKALNEADRKVSGDRHARGRGAADLTLDRVSFQYPGAERHVIRDVSVAVPPGGSLALTGHSGAGKTTLVDLVLGLLAPTSGQVMWGGTSVKEFGPDWHDLIAYVPQDVYLIDDTVEANIAFGKHPHEVDKTLLNRVIEQAQLSSVVAALEDGLDTRIGARGTRLSGGQRQRLGIARALYRQPNVIVFDEATSALDNATEFEISATIQSLRGQVTTIIVAHRLSTVKSVDHLLFLKDGQVEASGTFTQVAANSAAFARLVELGQLGGALDAN